MQEARAKLAEMRKLAKEQKLAEHAKTAPICGYKEDRTEGI